MAPFSTEQGTPDGQYLLGLSYGAGSGVIEDPIQAHKWLNLAASRMTGDKFTDAARFRDMVADDLSVSQLNTARDLAREWEPSTWEELREQ